MTDTRHLDDEALSAVLDGDTAPAHVGGCATCSVRLAELRRAVDAVAAPPPALTEARRRTMLDRAVAGTPRAVPHGDGHTDDDRVVPLRRPNVARWSGIAAVLVVLIGVGALVAGRGGDDDRTMSASRTADESAAVSAGLADEQPAVDGGDLGARRDPAELGGIIRDAVAAGPTTMAAPAAGGGSALDGTGAESATAVRSAGLPCRAEARTEYGAGIGTLVYGALVAWEDVPAVVLAYERPAAEGKVTYLGLVLARDGCRTLTSIFQTS